MSEGWGGFWNETIAWNSWGNCAGERSRAWLLKVWSVAPPGSLLEIQTLGPTLSLLNENLHFNETPGDSMYIKVQKVLWSRDVSWSREVDKDGTQNRDVPSEYEVKTLGRSWTEGCCR